MEKENKKTLQDKANSITFTLLLMLGMIAVGLIFGYFIGYINGIYDAALIYEVIDLKNAVNLTNNISDIIIMEI